MEEKSMQDKIDFIMDRLKEEGKTHIGRELIRYILECDIEYRVERESKLSNWV